LLKIRKLSHATYSITITTLI